MKGTSNQSLLTPATLAELNQSVMIFNFDFVTISSPSGLSNWGEFKEMDKMIHKLEELRINGHIHTTNNMVLMTGYINKKSGETRRIAVHKLAYLNEQWVLCFNMPKR